MASVLNRTASNITLGFRQVLSKSQLLSRSVAPITKLQSAGIAHKDNLDPEVVAKVTSPWPYEKKRFNLLHDYFGVDGYYNTTGRFTENSRVITVEGEQLALIYIEMLVKFAYFGFLFSIATFRQCWFGKEFVC